MTNKVRNASETYSNALYGSPVGTSQNNCYAYAIDHYKESGGDKLQPGELASVPGKLNLGNCDDLVSRALADAKAMGWTLRTLRDGERCAEGYKIVAVLAPNNDFHWYRHHKDLLYRVKTPRSSEDLAREFDVPRNNVIVPKVDASRVDVGDIVLIRNADVWSHKQGFSPDGPLLRDACGKIIKDPKLACRNYGSGLDYTAVCGTFCFKK